MLDDLKFVRSALASRDFIPELQFFRISGGRVTGYDGELAISSPIPIDLEVAPSGKQMLGAINACEDIVNLTFKKERLEVKSGKFKTLVQCVDVSTVPVIVPTGKRVEPSISIIEIFKTLLPFVGIDESKPWSTGILFRDQSAFATNNVVIIEHWLGDDLPTVNIPLYAIKEVLRYGKEPDHLLIDEGRISFMYDDGRWISSTLSVLEWPDVGRVLNVESPQYASPPSDLLQATEKLLKFGDKLGRCYFFENALATTQYLEESASMICEGLHEGGCYNLNHLRSILKLDAQIDFAPYPNPIAFVGAQFRGVMVGYRS